MSPSSSTAAPNTPILAIGLGKYKSMACAHKREDDTLVAVSAAVAGDLRKRLGGMKLAAVLG